MRTLAPLFYRICCLTLVAGQAQTLDAVSKALGAANLKSIEIHASGMIFPVGQSAGSRRMPWPRFNVKSFTRVVNYETASLRDEIVRMRALEPPRGGGAVRARRAAARSSSVSGDHAWNVTGDAAVPAPITLADRQFQLWSTPHGVVKAAIANKAHRAGSHDRLRGARPLQDRARPSTTRTSSRRSKRLVAEPGRRRHARRGALPDYQDFGGVKFPTRIGRAPAASPALDLTVTERASPNAAVDIPVPDTVRQATESLRARGEPEGRRRRLVRDRRRPTTAWSIEMKDHVIVVGGPAERRARARGDRRGADAGAEQADPLRRRQPPPLRSLGRRPRLRGRGHRRVVTQRGEPGVLRARRSRCRPP